jgi:hypothetical protein
MVQRVLIVCLCVGVLLVGIYLFEGSKRQPSLPLQQLPQLQPASREGQAGMSDPPFNSVQIKLDSGEFILPVDDLACLIDQPGAPICVNGVVFRGKWSPNSAPGKPDEGIKLTASFGEVWGGFRLGYELTALAPDSLYGQKRLSIRDLTEVKVRYTDDQIEADLAKDIPVVDLIDQLRKPSNQISDQFWSKIPGGEQLEFSNPLKLLMFRGEEARKALTARLDDPAIHNEVVLALGAVGDEMTVSELISRYPRVPIKSNDKAAVLKRVCFSFALSWLTGQPFDRSRVGTDPSPDNAAKWDAWWSANKDKFRVSPEKPHSTWVPRYPVLTKDDIARIKVMFAEQRDSGITIEYE